MKIAIFDYYKHTNIGGVEKYVRQLINTFKNEGHEVTEFFTMKSVSNPEVAPEIEGITSIDASSKTNYYKFKGESLFRLISQSPEYDIIINNSIDSKDSFTNPKIINIQHMGYEFYDTKGIEYIHRVLKNVFLGLGHRKNQLEALNVVFYSEGNNHGNSANPFYIPLCNDKDFVFKARKSVSNKILWMARHDEPHKGLGNLNEVYSLSNYKESFLIGGAGKDTNKIKVPKELIIGAQTKEQVLKLFSDIRMFILTSNYEGFGYTVVESLSAGVPVILYNTFDSASLFAKCPGVKLINPKDHASFSKAIEEIEKMNDVDWLKQSKEIQKFAKSHFTNDVFESKWKEVISNVKK